MKTSSFIEIRRYLILAIGAALIAAIFIIGGVLIATFGQNATESWRTGLAKGQDEIKVCEAAGIDTTSLECANPEEVDCPTNYNTTQCDNYRKGYAMAFELENIFEEFHEKLGEGLMGQQAFGQEQGNDTKVGDGGDDEEPVCTPPATLDPASNFCISPGGGGGGSDTDEVEEGEVQNNEGMTDTHSETTTE
jgi:hypothetical protein